MIGSCRYASCVHSGGYGTSVVCYPFQEAFGDDYYATSGQDEEKPEFSDNDDDPTAATESDDDGDMANWDEWTGETKAEENADVADDQPGPSGMAGRSGMPGKVRMVSKRKQGS